MKMIKILNDKVQIRTDFKEFQNVRLNDLVLVTDGDVRLVTIVSAVTDMDTEDDAELGENDYITEHSSVKVLECSIIGMQDGEYGAFKGAVDRYTTMNVSAEVISPEGFRIMMSKYSEGFRIGEYAAYGYPAYVDGNKFFQRHSCVLGNTGAGKSETVAKILGEVSKLQGANVIVFDIHGEYRE